ncbi:MAG: YihY/virulence factor BrkB family protein [Candidatus Omnitrophica bacterium]|nr:YihY/virulence factor BrkB family protein [Candidatus Omnitrophota bacterium]
MKQKIVNFITRDIWRIKGSKIPRKQFFLIKNLRIAILALRGFNEDKCSLRSSALTFYTLLSIVPIFAMAFGIAKGFGFEKLLEQHILEKFPAQNDVILNIINFANTALEHTRGGLIAGVGIAVLIWSVIKVLTNIEKSFNDIWGVKKMRGFGRRLSDYLSIMLICPIFLIFSSGLTVFVKTQAIMITDKIMLLGAISPLIHFLLDFLPYTVMWTVFSFIYIFIPNTKVNFKSGIIAGIFAGTIYQVIQLVYVNFQIGVGKYNAIYGSFAALPLFLIWLQLSWRIVLFGAEVSFAHQNVDTYEFEPDCLNVSHSFRRLLTLRVVNLLAKNFAKGEKPLSSVNISHELEIPIRLLRDILNDLTEAKVVSEIKTEENKGLAYQPGCDINLLTIKYVLDKLDGKGSEDIPVAQAKELNKISGSLKAFGLLLEKSPDNLLLRDI